MSLDFLRPRPKSECLLAPLEVIHFDYRSLNAACGVY
jgi:hypothetical protein